MNRKQRRVIWCGIVLLGIVLLVPPWLTRQGHFEGFAALFWPQDNYTLREILPLHREGRYSRVHVSLLLAEGLFVALGTVGAVAALQSHERRD
jgi:hypothetical protein